MNVFSLFGESRQFAKTGLYLPTIGFGYLFLFQNPQPLIDFPFIDIVLNGNFVGLVTTLISAASLDEFFDSLSGPSSEGGNTISEGDLIQRIGYTIYGAGSPKDYPSTLRKPVWRADVEVSLRSQFALLLYVASITILALSAPYILWTTSSFAVSNDDMIAGTIALIFGVYLTRLLVSSVWSNSYTVDSFDEPSINVRLEEFGKYVYDSELLEPIDGQYTPASGGQFEFVYQTQATTVEEELFTLEGLLVGAASIIGASEFPCEEFTFYVHNEERLIAQYSISGDLIDDFRTGEADIELLIERAVKSMMFKQKL